MKKDLLITPKVIAYQRVILSGLFIEENIKDENIKKFNLIKQILEYNIYLFLPIQVDILKKVKKDVEDCFKEGYYSAWIVSEIFENNLTDDEKAEYTEILGNAPLVCENIPYYLDKLKEEFYKQKIFRQKIFRKD